VTRIAGDWLAAAPTRAVFRLLDDAGYQALAVGGCVRNDLLGAPVADVDIATDARPEKVMALASRAGLHAVPTGIAHGTVTLVAGGQGFEITTFRRDVATDGRRAVVAYSDSMAEDAARRDFTMNALYARADGRVLDPLGEGLRDLRARRVRFIGDAGARIREDYLRILRFFRFHACHGDPGHGPDAEGLAACARLARGIETLSRERVGAEMRKLLAAPDPAPALRAMADAGVLGHVLPGACAAPLTRLVALERSAGQAADWRRRLFAMGGTQVVERLRLSRADSRWLDRRQAGLAEDDSPAVAGYRHGMQAAVDIGLLRAALAGGEPPADLAAEAARGAAARFPVNARDLMPARRGAALGRALADLEAQWIAEDFRPTREDLLARLPPRDH